VQTIVWDPDETADEGWEWALLADRSGERILDHFIARGIVREQQWKSAITVSASLRRVLCDRAFPTASHAFAKREGPPMSGRATLVRSEAADKKYINLFFSGI
jgi:hypothetical protein